ncbi:hypothetical protein EV190_12253 [Actinorugispora endophytica]|uniref:Uncharacterized protein n=1 Tax=Actinorugispora endophytica TaxID=1605990 RepID=A0A4R6UUR5_9ACTN|nr:hypothetical protein EV190_12253 [Actinorugispora endophytica]
MVTHRLLCGSPQLREDRAHTHPGLKAENHIQLLEQAPRVDAAVEAVPETGPAVIQASLEPRASDLHESPTVRERRCLTCETTYPCPTERELGMGEQP